MRKHTLGFTLVELFVTLAVLATLLGIAVPSYRALIERTRSATTFHLVTASMMSARAAAVTRGHPVTVCPSSDGMHCRSDSIWEQGWIIFDDQKRNGTPSGEDAILHRFPRLDGALRLRGTAGRQKLRYLGNGSAYGSNVSMHVCSAQGLLIGKVVVNNMGRARSQRALPSTPCPVPL